METVGLPARPADIGPFLKSLRLARGIKQNEVAEAMGVDPGAVWAVESGRKAPTYRTVLAYLGAIGYTLQAAPRATVEEPPG